jgi:hypothetical protein
MRFFMPLWQSPAADLLSPGHAARAIFRCFCVDDADPKAAFDDVANGRTVRMFTYPTIESARRAAQAWTVAYGNCPIVDKSGVKK